jgi:hypothetical protein
VRGVADGDRAYFWTWSGFRAHDQGGHQSGGHAVDPSREVARISRVRTHVTDCGVASIACIWPTPAHVTLPARDAHRTRAGLRHL